MAKQEINLGSAPNAGDGDPLRTAFNKINENFTELYNSTGGLDLANITESIIPSVDNTYNLGSPSKRWQHGYFATGSLYVGDIKLSNNAGQLVVQQVTNVGLVNEAPVPDTPGVVTTDRIINGANTFSITAAGELELNGDPFTGGGGSLTVGNGTSDSVENVTELLINGTITEIEPGVVGVTIAGGTSQPYLELTNTPFITQPVTLGTPVTITAAPWSHNARFTVEIEEGTPLGFSITITTPGTDYVVGQQYRLWGYNLGGPDVVGSIDFEVAAVGEDGELLGIADAVFAEGAEAATNTPGIYTDVAPQYLPSVFDDIDTGLVLTRGRNQGIFNIAEEAEYDNSNYLSPLGTEWNSDGWGDLSQLGTRTYTPWREALDGNVGENIIGAELVMHDTFNDKYYKFEFTEWGGNNGAGFAYTRTLITDPNYFRKTNNGDEVDVIVEDDGDGGGIGITRGVDQGIYNPYRESGWNSNTSPAGIGWNIDGWDDLSDIESRTYINFYAAYGNGQLGNRVPGSKAVIYVPDNGKYYAIDWISWTQGINENPQGGGFSYIRKEIDLTKLTQGITFADGTVQTTAYIPTNVISTAPNDRRIETASGYTSVAVTAESRGETLNATIRGTSNNWDFNVNATETLNLLYDQEVSTYSYLEFSFDNEATWVKVTFGGGSFEQYYQMVFDDGIYRSVTDGDTVRYRVVSGGESVVWWDKDELPSGGGDFRGAIIDYHAYTSSGTIIGTIHIIDDDGDEYITHTEVSSADSNDSMYDNLWIVTSEGEIRYARVDGSAKTLKIHWTAKVFYGSDYSDD